MPSLLSLPPELRQRILTLTLPPKLSYSKPWSRPLIALLHISHRLRSDMAELLSTWSPLHCISSPTSLRTLAAPTIPILLDVDAPPRAPKLETLSLSIFDEATEQRMHWTCYCQGPEQYSHPELVAAWSASVPYLPTHGISAVHLDVTPAPAAKRRSHQLALNMFVSDKRCAKTFLSCHVGDVSDLVRSVDAHYRGQVEICLTGTLSRKSKFFVTSVQMAAGRDVPFVGTWVERDKARFARLAHAVNRVAPEGQARGAARRGEAYPFTKFRETVWASETTWTWAAVAHGGEEDAAVQDLRRIATFEASPEAEVLEMQAVGAVRRALQHRIAGDLGLKSESEGEGEERHVVVRKGLESLTT